MKRAFLLVIVTLSGCSRAYWREQADLDVYPIIAERQVSPAYSIGNPQVESHPASRIADPFDPNHPPKPPDDFAAAIFMNAPDGIRGYRKWGKDGHVGSVELVDWKQALGVEPDGTLKLTQDRAVELALLNSREFQTQREQVYLAALGLTLNRFEFESQWFGRTGVNYTRTGASSLPTESNQLDVPSAIGFSRNLPAGGQLLVDFANSFVWEFTGKSSSVVGNFGASLVQPLLRNFGRDVRLESLTQAEREVLYTVRDFARFRKTFWADVAVDRGGYLDLLLLVQNVRNQRANLRNAEENYRLYQELFRGNRKSVVEVDQVYQQLLTSRIQVIQSEITLQNALDSFKLRLGLPPRLPIEIDDSFLDQFLLVSSELEELRDQVDQFERERKAELAVLPPADVIRGQFDTLIQLSERAVKSVEISRQELERWKSRLDRPIEAGDADSQEQREREEAAYAAQVQSLSSQIEVLEQLRKAIPAQRDSVPEDPTRLKSWQQTVDDIKKLASVLDAAIAAQTQSRIFLISVPKVDFEEDPSIQFAHANRLDLQNQLGRVTDAWRRVNVTANALQSDINLVANANAVTEPGARNPFEFANDFSRIRVGLQIDGPLNRRAERNVYRSSQIQYQRSRRAFMQLSDEIEAQIRVDLRNLRLQQLSFENARLRLLAAARQLENARLELIAPQQRPAGIGGGGDPTFQLISAQNSLLDARNALAASFINYEQQRIRLLIDLEALQLDDRGFPTNVAASTPDQSDRPAPPATGPDSGDAGAPAGPPAAKP